MFEQRHSSVEQGHLPRPISLCFCLFKFLGLMNCLYMEVKVDQETDLDLRCLYRFYIFSSDASHKILHGKRTDRYLVILSSKTYVFEDKMTRCWSV